MIGSEPNLLSIFDETTGERTDSKELSLEPVRIDSKNAVGIFGDSLSLKQMQMPTQDNLSQHSSKAEDKDMRAEAREARRWRGFPRAVGVLHYAMLLRFLGLQDDRVRRTHIVTLLRSLR